MRKGDRAARWAIGRPVGVHCRSEVRAAKVLGCSRGDGERQWDSGWFLEMRPEMFSCWVLVRRRETVRADCMFWGGAAEGWWFCSLIWELR